MERGVLEVVEYVPRQAMPDALPTDHPYDSGLWSRLRLERRTLTSCTAALIVLAVHIGLIAPVVWAGGASPQDQGFRGEADLQWVVRWDYKSVGHTGTQAAYDDMMENFNFGAVLALFAIAGLLSLYQALFWMWMTAYAPANAARAEVRLYGWLTIVLMAVLGFIVALVRLKKKR